ncbi:metallopeptidase TldD-related protein [Ruminococcus sp.]|uniref:metallopeptidase TldD-related protein n=1 Tax=Ruminococcus sp. TaxID=41978 RepID=UPI001B280E1F|nr:metallopeptidase TldD-related protein [Ruminococcus sp.]MBO5559071.1 hypothetical protein [Ruminococcus sp.]
MINLYNDLDLNKHLMNGYDLSEVYSSAFISNIKEYSASGIKEINSVFKGTSLRIFNKNEKSGKMILQNEDAENGFSKQYMQTIQVPYTDLPVKKIKSSEIILPEIIVDDTDDLFQKLNKIALEYGIHLKKISTNRFVSIYKITNSYGVEGYGYKLLNCANLYLTDKENNYKEYSKVFGNGSYYYTVKNMFPEISFDNNNTEIDKHEKCVLLSCHAVSEIVYLLLLFLNEQTPFAGRNFVTENKDSLFDIFNISPLINIIENSEKNEIIGGNVDGEGSEKKTTYIVKNGRLKNLISSYATTGKDNNTASSYRMEYKALPQCKPTKIWVANGERSCNEIIAEKETIAVVDSFHGMYESINPLTLEFSAVIRAKVYKYGKNIGFKSLKIKSNLLKILSSVTELSIDMSYIGDGSIIVPAMLCDFDNI